MAELIFFLCLAAPVFLIWWLIVARRRAEGLMRERAEPYVPPLSTFAYEEGTAGADGLTYGRSYGGDASVLPPGDQTGVVDGIKAIEGRR